MATIRNKTYYIDPSSATMGDGLTPETPFNRLSPYAAVGGWWPGFGGGNTYPGCKFLIKAGSLLNTRNPYGTSNDFSVLRWELGSTEAENPVTLSWYGGTLPTNEARPVNPPKFVGNSESSAGGAASTAVMTGIYVNTTNVIVDGFDISNMRLNNVANYMADNSQHSGVVVKNCYIHDSQYNTGVNESGIYLYGSNIKAINNRIERIGVDAIWMNGANAEAGFNTIIDVGMFVNPGTGVGDGDGIQFSGYSSDIYCHDNYIDHSKYDSKHCIILSTIQAGVSGGLICRNIIKGVANPSVNLGIYVSSPDVAIIGNHVEGGWHSLVISTETNSVNAMNTLVVGNLFVNPRYNNIEWRNDGAKTAMTGVVIRNNTMVRSNTETGRNINKSLGSTAINQASPGDIDNNIFINNGSTGSKHQLISEYDTLGDNLYHSTVSGMNAIYSYGTAGSVAISTGSLKTDPKLDDRYALTSDSPAALIGTADKFWALLLPISGMYQLQVPVDPHGNPFPESFIDWGACQSQLHKKSPLNVVSHLH